MTFYEEEQEIIKTSKIIESNNDIDELEDDEYFSDLDESISDEEIIERIRSYSVPTIEIHSWVYDSPKPVNLKGNPPFSQLEILQPLNRLKHTNSAPSTFTTPITITKPVVQPVIQKPVGWNIIQKNTDEDDLKAGWCKPVCGKKNKRKNNAFIDEFPSLSLLNDDTKSHKQKATNILKNRVVGGAPPTKKEIIQVSQTFCIPLNKKPTNKTWKTHKPCDTLVLPEYIIVSVPKQYLIQALQKLLSVTTNKNIRLCSY